MSGVSNLKCIRTGIGRGGLFRPINRTLPFDKGKRSLLGLTADSEKVTYEMNGITSGKGKRFAGGGNATFEFESTRIYDDLYYVHLMLAHESFHLVNIRNVRARRKHQEHNFSVFLLEQ